MARWLRRKADGVIYGYHEALAKQTEILEEVSEEEAWPERQMPPVDEAVQVVRAKKSGLATALSGEIPPQEQKDDTKLRAEASRKLPK